MTDTLYFHLAGAVLSLEDFIASFKLDTIASGCRDFDNRFRISFSLRELTERLRRSYSILIYLDFHIPERLDGAFRSYSRL